MKLPKIPQPIVWWTWRVNGENRRLRAEVDVLKSELAVSKTREKRWRRHASLVSAGDPKAEWAVAAQCWSDDMADLPELEDRHRNTPPRSAP